MEDEKKSLIYMYVEDYCGFRNESFNFDLCDRYHINISKNDIKRKVGGLEPALWKDADFFGSGILGVTLLIGENGSGKTSLIRLLIGWLCRLSDGELPDETGALVFRDGERKLGIAFQAGKEWTLSDDEKIVEWVHDVTSVRAFLKDVSLVYYTDTMTDLDVSHEKLKDYSLLSRLASSMSQGIGTVGISADLRVPLSHADFLSQLGYLCSLDQEAISDYPFHHIKFVWDETELPEPFGYINLKEWTQTVLNTVKGSLIPLLAGDLLSGLIQYTLTLPLPAEAEVVSFFRGGLRTIERCIIDGAPSKESVADAMGAMADLMKNLCEQFDLWLSAEDKEKARNACKECEAFMRAAIPLWVNGDFDSWQLHAGKDAVYLWNQLESVKVNWEGTKSFYQAYAKVSFLLPGCGFDWLYPSSGEVNLCNLYACVLAEQSASDTVWYFLDEPDNAFHPQWKRTAMENILRRCGKGKRPAQLWITTHSPIMLSDVPKQAAIFLKREDPGKVQCSEEAIAQPFAQQIYQLFNDAFFLDEGVSGTFAEKKLKEAFNELDTHERKAAERLQSIVDEPLLRGYLTDWLKREVSVP